MELSKQVCSLELAKRLKELGVEQESLFYWNASERPKNFKTKNFTTPNPNAAKKGYLNTYFEWTVDLLRRKNDLTVSAFTVAELYQLHYEKFGTIQFPVEVDPTEIADYIADALIIKLQNDGDKHYRVWLLQRIRRW